MNAITLTTPLAALREQIRQHSHSDEHRCVEALQRDLQISAASREQALQHGRSLLLEYRRASRSSGVVYQLMQEYSLSNQEGVALMCLAEALLRVPDRANSDQLIAERIATGDWAAHCGEGRPLLVSVAGWGLAIAAKLLRWDGSVTESGSARLKRQIGRLARPTICLAMRAAMKVVGHQYVLGADVVAAQRRGHRHNPAGTRFSFDRLGEAARCQADADRYTSDYRNAIAEMGQHPRDSYQPSADSLSIKLSALHPRYQPLQRQRVRAELLPRLIELATLAKRHQIGLTIDAEESERLELSLDLFAALAAEPTLAGWDGLGFVVQAYSKRAPMVIDWLAKLADHTSRQIPVRLVKGAYWDREIKHAQEQGHDDYPVYTRKAHTDLSYQCCTEKLFAAGHALFPQFATHNSYTVALVEASAAGRPFELQRLHGMGEPLYHALARCTAAPPVRVYAPVGAHRELLPYLVRRLLENGANSSFVNRALDPALPIEAVFDELLAPLTGVDHHRHSGIPLPAELLRHQGEERQPAAGVDLAHPPALQQLLQPIVQFSGSSYHYASSAEAVVRVSPADLSRPVGTITASDSAGVAEAIGRAAAAQLGWCQLGGRERGAVLSRAADQLAGAIDELVALISYEAGRTLADGVDEVREAVDFLRYYALAADTTDHTDSPPHASLGQFNHSQRHGRGVFACISPWNFPLAIFIGQLAAALAAGNSVVAKPATQTPLVASRAVALLRAAGLPADVLQLVIGDAVVGQQLVASPHIAGVAFTGSNATAQRINRTLAARPNGGQQPILIAETGGQNALLVDSTALTEQVVDDVIRSAFQSAGQRCSALRVLYLQEEIADQTVAMLIGAMAELQIGAPWLPATDVGPLIDAAAVETVKAAVDQLQQQSGVQSLYRCQLPPALPNGHYLAPQLIEIESISQLRGEVFGPVLHVIRYSTNQLECILGEINATGFGLTLGVHSRLQGFAEQVVANTRAGNNYINRNIVGAVVGVQPFGGNGLSGTGPKAGGPLYLPQFSRPSRKPSSVTSPATALPTTQLCSDNSRTAIVRRSGAALAGTPVGTAIGYFAERAEQLLATATVLPGPTGETNYYGFRPRGTVGYWLTDNQRPEQVAGQIGAAIAAGNRLVVAAANPSSPALITALAVRQQLLVDGLDEQALVIDSGAEAAAALLARPDLTLMLCDQPKAVAEQLAAREGAVITCIDDHWCEPNFLLRLVSERTVTTNVVATGGNAALLTLVE